MTRMNINNLMIKSSILIALLITAIYSFYVPVIRHNYQAYSTGYDTSYNINNTKNIVDSNQVNNLKEKIINAKMQITRVGEQKFIDIVNDQQLFLTKTKDGFSLFSTKVNEIQTNLETFCHFTVRVGLVVLGELAITAAAYAGVALALGPFTVTATVLLIVLNIIIHEGLNVAATWAADKVCGKNKQDS